MFESWRQFIYTYRILNNLTNDLNRYSLQVVPRHINSPPLSAAPSQASPAQPQQPTTAPVSHLNNAAVPKSQHTLSRYLQHHRGALRPVAASARVSRPPKNDLVQQRQQAKNEALQMIALRHQPPPTNLPSFILPSFLAYPFPSRSLLPPILRAADIPQTGASAIDDSLQSRDLVPLNYFKDIRLVPSGSSTKVDNSLPDHQESLQEDDTAATRGGPSNPIMASDPAASEQPTSGDQSPIRQSNADCNDGSREPSPDDASEEIETWRERFLLEFINLAYGPSEKEIRQRIQFFHNHSGMTQDELDEARKPYERVCYRQSARSILPFEIDGRPETYQLDRIKCWVNFDLHLVGTHPVWPKDYVPVCTKKELLDAELFARDDDALSEYTMQSVTVPSLA